MLRGLIMTMALCLTGAMCAPTRGEQVVFAGTITQNGKIGPGPFSFGNGTAAFFAFSFTPNGAGVAAISSAVLQIDSGGDAAFSPLNTTGGTLTVGLSGADSTITAVLPNGGGSRGSDNFAGMLLTGLKFTSIGNSGPLTDDIGKIFAANPFVSGSVSGDFFIQNGVTTQIYNFSGAAVPEPGSMALLSGLGLVFGAAARRRRNARKSAV